MTTTAQRDVARLARPRDLGDVVLVADWPEGPDGRSL